MKNSNSREHNPKQRWQWLCIWLGPITRTRNSEYIHDDKIWTNYDFRLTNYALPVSSSTGCRLVFNTCAHRRNNWTERYTSPYFPPFLSNHSQTYMPHTLIPPTSPYTLPTLQPSSPLYISPKTSTTLQVPTSNLPTPLHSSNFSRPAAIPPLPLLPRLRKRCYHGHKTPLLPS